MSPASGKAVLVTIDDTLNAFGGWCTSVPLGAPHSLRSGGTSVTFTSFPKQYIGKASARGRTGVTHTIVDLRKEVRYRLEAPATFTWENFQGRFLRGEGVTRDISLFGAFILTPIIPPNLSFVQIEMALPALAVHAPDIRIVGRARVVRIEHFEDSQDSCGIAVVRSNRDYWTMLSESNDAPWNNSLLMAGETGVA
jgi:hypothetical protein